MENNSNSKYAFVLLTLCTLISGCISKPERTEEKVNFIPVTKVAETAGNQTQTRASGSQATQDQCADITEKDAEYYACVDRTKDADKALKKDGPIILRRQQ